MTSKRRLGTPAEDTISAAEFKAKCLSLMEDVASTKRPLTVTKRGKAIARLVPVDRKEAPFVGFLSGCVISARDLDKPTGEVWEAESE